MKPKNKFQEMVIKIKVPFINAQQKKECRALFKHMAIRTKTRGTTCMECGHTFDLDHNNNLLMYSIETECKCPKCKQKLIYLDTRKRMFQENDLFSILTIVDGMQCIRYYEIIQKYIYGKPATYDYNECARIFITPKGKYAVIGKLEGNKYYSKTYFAVSGDFVLRSSMKSYMINCETWSGSKIIPEIYRNGFNGDLRKHSEAGLFITLLSNNKMETLWKLGRYDIFERFYTREKELDAYWPQLLLCFKHNYDLTQYFIWQDYIGFLKYFNKDVTNAALVCPADLQRQHDIYMMRKRKIQKKLDLQKKLLQLKQQEDEFIKLKGKYLNVEFEHPKFMIRTLNSVQEYVEVGEAMHHCIYDSRYYSKKDTLILSAFVDDKPIETVELDLNKGKVVQCRGKLNQNTKYHNDIIKLTEQNINLFNINKSSRKRSKQLA